jgi:hypothetical protein
MRAVCFIFCDSIYMTGHLLFASLLRWRTANHLADMEDALGNGERSLDLRARAVEMLKASPEVFGYDVTSGGWFIAATDVGRQPDVWGTIYAL